MSSPFMKITYNDVELPFCRIGYSTRIEYDTTGRSVVGVAVTFRGTCMAMSSSNAGNPPAQNTAGSFQTQLLAITNALSLPRKTFIWKNGFSSGEVLFTIFGSGTGSSQSVATGFYVDRRNGPLPRVVSIKEIPGGVASQIEFEIEAFVYPLCDTPSDLIEFAWVFSYGFDRDQHCQRKINGVYRFRSGTALNVSQSVIPQGIFFPPLPYGFYRQSVDHAISADGLTLNWAIIDRQVWRTLPRPFTSGESTSSFTLEGPTILKQWEFNFGAPTDVDKAVIIDFTLRAINYKFAGAFANPPTEFITRFSFSSPDFDNRVSGNITSRAAAAVGSQTTGPQLTTGELILDIFGDIAQVKPSAGDPTATWFASDGLAKLYAMTGTAGLLPKPPGAFDLCGGVNPGTLQPGDQYNSPGTDPGTQVGPGQTATNPTGATGTPANVSAAQLAAPYISFVETHHWTVRRNLVPIAVMSSSFATALIQQTAWPEVVVIQVGHAVRYNKPPNIPEPAFVETGNGGDGSARVASQSINPTAPRLLSDGKTLEYKLGWSYTIIMPALANTSASSGQLANTSTYIPIPINPQLGEQLAVIYTGSPLETLDMEPNAGGGAQPDIQGDGVYSTDYRYTQE